MLTRSQVPLLEFDPDIERTERRLRQETRRKMAGENARADTRTLLDYLAPADQTVRSAISVPAIQANNFELRIPLVNAMQGIQFGGTPGEDPHMHIRKFLQLANTVKMNGVTSDTIRLILFPFSVTDRVNNWLNNSLPEGSITTWDQLQRQFLTHYFPPSLSSKLLTEIASFTQHEGESMYDAWERFQELLLRCPHHNYQLPQLVQIFYNSLSYANRAMIDAACGGGIMNRIPADTWRIMGEIATNSHQWRSTDRLIRKKEKEPQASGLYHLDQSTALASQIESLTKKMDELMQAQAQPIQQAHSSLPTPSMTKNCNFCGSISHTDESCLVGVQMSQQREEVNYMGNTYNPSWKNHPNLSWGGKQNGPNYNTGPSNTGSNYNVYKPPHLQNQGGYKPERKEPSFQECIESRVQTLENRVETGFKNVESLVHPNLLQVIQHLLQQRYRS